MTTTSWALLGLIAVALPVLLVLVAAFGRPAEPTRPRPGHPGQHRVGHPTVDADTYNTRAHHLDEPTEPIVPVARLHDVTGEVLSVHVHPEPGQTPWPAYFTPVRLPGEQQLFSDDRMTRSGVDA